MDRFQSKYIKRLYSFLIQAGANEPALVMQHSTRANICNMRLSHIILFFLLKKKNEKSKFELVCI